MKIFPSNLRPIVAAQGACPRSGPACGGTETAESGEGKGMFVFGKAMFAQHKKCRPNLKTI